MLIRFVVCFLCMGLVAQAQQQLNLCDARANTILDCVGDLEDGVQDKCPNLPSEPCCTDTQCEYNPGPQIVQPWHSQTYTWKTRGFVTQAQNANLLVNRYKVLQPGQEGRKTKHPVGQWQKKTCEERFLCECDEDILNGGYNCVATPCGTLEIWNIVRDTATCVAGQGGGGGGGGGGGPPEE